ncbi:MAG: ADP-forming succinate--CoA ligase subunit beta [Candidatus Fermentibacteraceae bacterium]|nr:ADP-forming succinate--CoA ligase subunit beta [Candidatus Fermentibacteraceae bacterium]MBN2608381.1 ADP-forming succinate--CoA ligase subunit beta [Candidatus Fermentibacteraceae bacterium]
MKLEEFQAKKLFREHGIPAPDGVMVTSAADGKTAALALGCPVVVKAQVKTGGRGKAGGVKLARTPDEAFSAADSILGMDIKGFRVERLLIDPAVPIAAEYYVGITIDRKRKIPVMMVSASGGMDIEKVAAETPEKIHFQPVHPERGLRFFEAKKLAFRLFSDSREVMAAASIMVKLWKCFNDLDATLAEINPLARLEDGSITALDAKIVLDDNALYRHPGMEELRLPTPSEKKELGAKSHGLSYVQLEGEIGCMVNGAGLAMATMDVIKHLGGTPANFLDIGGSSNPEKVVHAMELLVSDSNVKAIFINVFGGITRCDDVANGLVQALSGIDLEVPMVVRLTGTNEEEGIRILAGHGITALKDMTRGAAEAIRLAREGSVGR